MLLLRIISVIIIIIIIIVIIVIIIIIIIITIIIIIIVVVVVIIIIIVVITIGINSLCLHCPCVSTKLTKTHKGGGLWIPAINVINYNKTRKKIMTISYYCCTFL